MGKKHPSPSIPLPTPVVAGRGRELRSASRFGGFAVFEGREDHLPLLHQMEERGGERRRRCHSPTITDWLFGQ